jgi:hypothetical protein
MNLDYQIAKDYLNKLPDVEKTKLCNRTLGEVKERKQSKSQLRKFYSDYLKNKRKTGKI